MALIETIPAKEDYRRKIAYQLMKEGSDATPIVNWAQGLARLGQGALGGYEMYQADQKDKTDQADAAKTALALLSGGGITAAPAATTASAAPAAAPVAAPAPNYGNAISSIESGGKYDLLGPVTKTGDRAYGKYQVMGANVPQWTKEYLGQEMTPQAFLANPDAQDKVFQGKFGNYAQKYGPEGAAKAWFAGEGGMNNPNAKDQLGTTVSSYGQRFMKALGGDQPYDVAGAAAAAPQAAAPAAPQAAPQAARPAVDPRLVALLQGTPAQQKIGIALANQALAEQFNKPSYDFKVVGENLVKTDNKGNASVVPNMSAAKPTYGVISQNEFGKPVYGWMDPSTKTTTPGTPQAATSQPVTIPGPDGPIVVPPGQDPNVYREAASKSGAANSLPASFDDTSKMRTELSKLPSYQNISQAAPIYKSMYDAAGRNTKAADLNMVYGLGKIMDPGSVVREGEIHMANNAQGWQEKLNGVIAQINGQGGLTPEGRQMIMAEALSRMQSYKQMYDQDAERFRGIATRNRANPADVVHDFGEFNPWTVPSKAPAATAQIDDLVKKYAK